MDLWASARVRADRGGVAASATATEAAASAIDRAHLTRMTDGERELEREVLRLFAQQTALLAERIRDAEPAAAAALAHTLAGSAQSIGAWSIAEMASAIEQAAASGRETAAAVERLMAAVRAAQAEIADLLRG